MVILGGIWEEPDTCLLQDNIKWRKSSSPCPSEEGRLEIVEEKSVRFVTPELLGGGGEIKLSCFPLYYWVAGSIVYWYLMHDGASSLYANNITRVKMVKVLGSQSASVWIAHVILQISTWTCHPVWEGLDSRSLPSTEVACTSWRLLSSSHSRTPHSSWASTRGWSCRPSSLLRASWCPPTWTPSPTSPSTTTTSCRPPRPLGPPAPR